MSLIYEDEILPEIDIRELLTLEQALEDNPSFVAFTRNEIIEHLYDLLPESHNAETIAETILNTITRAPASRRIPSKNVVPVLEATLGDFSSDLDDYLAKLDDIKTAPNYATQQELRNRLTYPLEYTPPNAGEVGFTATPETGPVQVGLRDIHNLSKLLPSDGVEEAVASYAYMVPNATEESYLFEKAVSTLPKIVAHAPPSFQGIVQLLTEAPDIHILKTHLSRFDYSFDNLTTDQLATLTGHIKTLPDPDTAAAPRRTSTRAVTNFSAKDFYDALKNITTHVLPKEKYSAIYDSLMTSIPPQTANIDVPLDTSTILSGIRDNKWTLEDVTAFLRMSRNKIVIDNAFVTLQRYLEIEPEGLPERIQAAITKWMRRTNRYDDRTARVFLDMYRDVAELKKGSDTSMYDGDPSQQTEQVFEETKYEYLTLDSDDETNEEMIVEDDTSAVQDAVANQPDGVKELLIPIFRKIARLSKASGVPINFKELTAYITPRVVRISFTEILQQYVPELASEVRLQLASGNYESAMRIAVGIVPVALGDRAQAVVREMYKEYTHLMKAIFLQCFAWYVLSTQEAALEKRLDFDPLSGMLACIKMWTPFGAPVTKEKEPEGVIYYLVCVAQESLILEDFKWTSEDLMRKALETMSENMSHLVEPLRAKWEAYAKENTMTISKARQANLSLAEAIQMKLKKRILPDYVKAFLYIPGMLSASKHPPYSMGCCMQQLGPLFRADTDWQDMKKLKGVKDQFAKKRMTKIPPPFIALPGTHVPIAASAKSTKQHPLYDPTRDVPSVVDINGAPLTDWLHKCKEQNLFLLPPDVVDAVLSDSSSVNSSINRNISALLKTSGKKSPAIEAFFAKSSLDIPRMLGVVATSLQQSLELFSEGTIEHTYLIASISYITRYKTCVRDLPPLANPVDVSTLHNITRYVVSRAACLPADSKNIGRSGKLDIGDRVSDTFLSRVLTRTVSTLGGMVTNLTMPTAEQQQAFITKMREIQKVQTLEVLNNQTEEDRLFMIDAKKAGLFKVTVDYSEAQEEPPMLDDEEEPEYTYRGEEDHENGDGAL